MAIINSGTKIAFGFGLGIVAAGVVKEILPAFQGLGKPLLKATVKSALILARDGRVRLAEFRETLADVAAEAQNELDRTAAEVKFQEQGGEVKKQAAGVM
jgi:Protein of unknown function (DUF5132)